MLEKTRFNVSNELAELIREGKAFRTKARGGIEYIITDKNDERVKRLSEAFRGREHNNADNPTVDFRLKESEREKTMDDFWIAQGWFKKTRNGIRLTIARWSKDPATIGKAVEFLIDEILKIDPRDVTKKDFYDNHLGGLLDRHCNGSPFAAISYTKYSWVKPWEMVVTPHNYFDDRLNRITATRWLFEKKLRIDPRNARQRDFSDNRLRGLLKHYNSLYSAISDAYPEIPPWEMKNAPRHQDELWSIPSLNSIREMIPKSTNSHTSQR